MNPPIFDFLIASIRVRAALEDWGRGWAASQAEAAERSIARRIDPNTGRPLLSWPGISRYR
jgi:hypothetical protein